MKSRDAWQEADKHMCAEVLQSACISKVSLAYRYKQRGVVKDIQDLIRSMLSDLRQNTGGG